MENNNKKAWWVEGVAIALRISGLIAGPIIVALILGKYLDKKYSTEPWIFIGLSSIAFIITIIGIVKFSLNYIKKLESKNNDKK